MKPRVLFVSRERFRLPLTGAQKRKWDAVASGSSASARSATSQPLTGA